MSTAPPSYSIPADLAAWLDAHAESLDTEPRFASDILSRLAQAGLLSLGVSAEHANGQGSGNGSVDGIEAIAQVATHSLSAAFVFWGHRTFTEYVLSSPNSTLRETWLPRLLRGEIAGASGLSNVMKYLSALEPLHAQATPLPSAAGRRRWRLSGRLPWITNLRREGFIAAVAFDRIDGGEPVIFAVPHDLPGISRSEDLDLIALRATNTAALHIEAAEIDERLLLADDARSFLARLRPSFVGFQCGMSIGLARRALASVASAPPAIKTALAGDVAQMADTLAQRTEELFSGIATQRYLTDAAALFKLRIALADVAATAIQLDIAANGGRGYLNGQSVARRVREASFIPIVTPNIVQLKHQLALHGSAS
ncbi:MAG: acyl-CoA/acyl-ACP dehydrogenase [Burkholderiaceae bacterium]|jgi:alkylation response protein AidB-like acyl-CoA dehydrogenase|nr:acyl-CoA/acyl-ACP dehydrogenase [Burkholderiaceae bacterium]